MTIRKVAMLGLGLMGGGMAGNLLKAGFEVTVWNRSPDKAQPFVDAGARLAATPAEAARDADVIVSMLADDDASRAVWLDSRDGAATTARDGVVAIEASTLTADWVRSLGRSLKGYGIDFLDAPVTGSRQQAAEGKLRFLVGGDAAVLERAAPVLGAMGSEAVHLGPTGSGALLKLVNNFLCGVQVASAAEAVAMIERSGLDVRRAVDLLATGAPGSPLLGAVTKRMLDQEYEPQFFVPLMAKDLSYARGAFAEQGIELTSALAAKARFDAAAEAGYADRDVAAIVELLRDDRA